MKVYWAIHSGVWPVGAGSVVVAKSQAEAFKQLEAELDRRDIIDEDLEVSCLWEIDTTKSQVIVVCDGQY